jgi:hypothetical protein
MRIKESKADLRKREFEYPNQWTVLPKTLRDNRVMDIKTGYKRDRVEESDIFNGVY